MQCTMSRFSSWVGEAIGAKFLAQGNKSRKTPSRNQAWVPNVEPHVYQADAQTTGLLLECICSGAKIMQKDLYFRYLFDCDN